MRTAGDTWTTLLSPFAPGLMASVHDEPVTLQHLAFAASLPCKTPLPGSTCSRACRGW